MPILPYNPPHHTPYHAPEPKNIAKNGTNSFSKVLGEFSMSFITFEMLLVTKRSIFMTLGAQSAPPGKIGLRPLLLLY